MKQSDKQKLSTDTAVFLMIDIQEVLTPLISNKEEVVKNNAIMLQGAKEMGLQTIVTEQYPQGLGNTVAELRKHIQGLTLLEKTSFSLYSDYPEMLDNLMASGKTQFILTGTESHICVYQTAEDLLKIGAEVFVVSDGVGSRSNEHRRQILQTLLHMGACVLPAESVLFELMGSPKHQAFKAVSRLVK